jgi:D-alanine-D-alanine ligase
MRRTRVLILYNEPTLPRDHPDAESECEVVYTAEAVTNALEPAGFRVHRLGVGRDPAELLRGLRKARPDVVFNLFEGLGDWGETEAYAVGLVEWLGIPYTGCPLQPTVLARNKPLAKKLFVGARLPTAAAVTIDELPLTELPLTWPIILKPATQDASIGIDQGSVVTSLDSLQERAAYLLDTYGPPVLAEEYIDGREFCVGMIETPDLRCLPVTEMDFRCEGEGWPIVTYDAKWKPGTPEYELMPNRPDATVGRALTTRLNSLAKRAFRLLGCRDYARVDFRVKPSGKAFILEVNPNPDIHPAAGLAHALEAAGVGWAAFCVGLVERALARGRRESVRGGLKLANLE